jgi:hypothetical protein
MFLTIFTMTAHLTRTREVTCLNFHYYEWNAFHTQFLSFSKSVQLVPHPSYSSALKMEAEGSPVTSITTCQTTQCHILKDRIFIIPYFITPNLQHFVTFQTIIIFQRKILLLLLLAFHCTCN